METDKNMNEEEYIYKRKVDKFFSDNYDDLLTYSKTLFENETKAYDALNYVYLDLVYYNTYEMIYSWILKEYPNTHQLFKGKTITLFKKKIMNILKKYKSSKTTRYYYEENDNKRDGIRLQFEENVISDGYSFDYEYDDNISELIFKHMSTQRFYNMFMNKVKHKNCLLYFICASKYKLNVPEILEIINNLENNGYIDDEVLTRTIKDNLKLYFNVIDIEKEPIDIIDVFYDYYNDENIEQQIYKNKFY